MCLLWWYYYNDDCQIEVTLISNFILQTNDSTLKSKIFSSQFASITSQFSSSVYKHLKGIYLVENKPV